MRKPNRSANMFLTAVRTKHNQDRATLAIIGRRAAGLASGGQPSVPYGVRQRIGNRYKVLTPNVLTLFSEEDYEAAMDVIRQIRIQVLKNRHKVVLDLRDCSRLDAAAVLKIHAEIDLLERLHPVSGRNVVVLLPKSARAKSFLHRVGFCARAQAPDGAGLLALQSHDDGSKALSDVLKHMNRSLYNGEAKTDGEEWVAMSLALSEAMLNVRNHAYTFEIERDRREIWPERQTFVNQIGRRWWLVGETHDDQLFLAIYDKGVGIPRALTKKDPAIYKTLSRLMRMVASKFNGGPDSAAIKAAMALGVSGTKRGGRGYGLNDISQFVKQNPVGELRIFSNRGLYNYHSKSKSEELFDRRSSIHGTLIVWNVALADIRKIS